MEIPPWTIADPGGGQFYFCHNGTNTFAYNSSTPLAPRTSIDLQGHGPYLATGPVLTDPWRRNYSGIYCAQAIQHPTEGLIDLAFCHNENKNICGGPHNTIDPEVPTNCSNPYQGYFALVTGVWTFGGQEKQGFPNTLGPILWPGSAYAAPDGAATTQGLLQPSSIVDSGYIYVFIWDKGPMTAGPHGNPGITRGIKVVRAPLAGCLDPMQYKVYYRDPSGNVQWLQSLPDGFSYANMLNFVKVRGPLSTDILPDELTSNTECFRFTAARVNGTNYFVGLEEYVDHRDMNTDASSQPMPRHHVALRLSYDLVNWSPRVAVIETSANWNASGFNYPIFLSADGTSNTAVDLGKFDVIGTHSQPPFMSALPMLTVSCSGSASTSPNADSMIFSTRASVFANSGATANLFPNPTHGSVKLNYALNTATQVQVLVTDVMGRPVMPLAAEWRPAGSYTEDLPLGDVAVGIYFVELMAGEEKRVFRVVVE